MEAVKCSLDSQLEMLQKSIRDSDLINERLQNYRSIKSKLSSISFQESSSTLENLPQLTRLTAICKQKNAESTIRILKNPRKDFKRNFVKIGGNINDVYNKLNSSWSKNYLEEDVVEEPWRISPEEDLKKQVGANPIFVDSNGEVLDIGVQTKFMINRQKAKGFITEVGGVPFLRGRHLIGTNTPINLGVYPGGGIDRKGKYTREILVVDYDRDIALQVFFNEFVSRIESSGKKDIISIINLYDKLISPMINLQKSLELENKYTNKKVELGTFLAQNGVVCRHSALLFAAIMERMKLLDFLPYRVDCTLLRINDFWIEGQRGKHVYCKLQINGRIFIVDPVQKCSGPLEIVGKLKPYAAEGDLWNYFLLGQNVNVFRNNAVLESGWTIESIKEITNSHFDDLITVSKIEDNTKLIKTITFDTLRDWQNISNIN
jgi:hypothetical protein